jgi:hypothetical protein
MFFKYLDSLWATHVGLSYVADRTNTDLLNQIVVAGYMTAQAKQDQAILSIHSYLWET